MIHGQIAGSSTIVLAVNEGEAFANGDTFPAFSDPVLNEVGQVAFHGFVVGSGFNGPIKAGGVYVGDGISPLKELVRFGDPGLSEGWTAQSFSAEAINDSGVVAYLQTDISADGNDLFSRHGLLLNDGVADPTVVVREGDLDPEGELIDSVLFSNLDANSRVGAQLRFDVGDVRSTVLFEQSTGLRTLAKEEQPAPDGVGVVGGAFFPSLNNAGQTLFSPRIKRPGFPQRPALFRETPGEGREFLFRSEDPATAPNVDGTVLLESYNPSMNALGQVIFQGSVSDAADPANNGLGLFVVDTPNGVTPEVREGQVVPGSDTSFAGFSRPSLNDEGELAFYALLTDDPSQSLDREYVGLYRQDASGLTEIARESQPAPGGDGTLDLVRFNNTSPGLTPLLGERPVFNDVGQVAFLSDLANTSSGNDDAAIYFFDNNLGLNEIVRTGSPLLDSTIVELGFKRSLSVEGDEELGFNDVGQIAYRFALADGREGIALWSGPPAICFPNTLGDITGDGRVQFDDFLILSANFGRSVSGHQQGDLDCDGKVLFADFLVLSANFGRTVSQVEAVPEPSASFIMATALLGVGVIRRRIFPAVHQAM